MTDHTEAPDLLALARETVLEALAEYGPLALPQIPRRWPVTRPMLHVILVELQRDGLVSKTTGTAPGVPAYTLTPAGKQATGTGRMEVLRFPRHPLSAPATAY